MLAACRTVETWSVNPAENCPRCGLVFAFDVASRTGILDGLNPALLR
jgi:hypothetical protein